MTENANRIEKDDGFVTVEHSDEEKRELYGVDGPEEDGPPIRWLHRQLLDNRCSGDERE